MNSELYDKTYRIPPDVLKYIQATLVSTPGGEGVKRAKFLLKNGSITYQDMKRLKNFFDHFDQQVNNKMQYALAGGDLMKSFIETSLATDRNAVAQAKKVTQDANVNPNLELQPSQTPVLNEEKKKDKKELKKNAVAIIVNDDNKILLLKRADHKEYWMPNKWALVGGGIEKGESPEEAVKREIKEETDLDIKKFIKTFSIQRHSDSIEHIFACRFNGDTADIALDQKENTKYGWFSVEEMEYLDTVPHLIEYITLTFKKYD
jgi:8-oxo-dGTP diphosphatase